MRRFNIAVLAALTLSTALSAAPAQAHPGGPRLGLDNCTATACHFDVPPGTYDVKVLLGGDAASATSITGETRRSLLPETAVPAGERTARSFTVNVRTPEGEPTGPDGTPGLDLALGGAAPALAGIQVTPARHARQIFLVGDSTVCDQPGDPYSGWGQQLPQYLRKGISVANYADSGESTVTYLANPQLWATVQPLIRPGDLVLVQLAHNDKTTDEATYRANLEALVAGIREKQGRPVLVTPIVRRWFNSDGTLNNGTALLVNGLGVDHPAVIRSVAAAEDIPLIDLTAKTKALVESLGPEGSKAIYLYNEKRDNTHTSVHGATVYAELVRDELAAQHLVPEGLVREG
ncbi:rhamnogalacturonan acetylesterase [Streptomyces acidiscabies]|uniref:Rhamnogalacturonan acetylesterase n=1 Tax=Streptomyces acidiscabies TaxID=42234 RepID=A0AAP6EF29_9ACTN|nr:rhamnogalacturonan acetylesterase [Streptomyces acidiscabies]MBP5936111.1 rhamnogalacturonan acetylesterase [Streptomyces sp. LBUM 1476]MBZ3915957.1 rhamnogalacturonan acetylesterase [Streptomyces acidiscabies]MDX2960349.1 rhamnogalacturonan acetylesterase [Streptomyces acidiscabies]MDX3023773.1 rhamnogalacturonan acetylesterase [Streptomyces acidiscabies]MDX3793980.1 rhamnogalacturonan acetylesterase [Streptomyces acidiscabies]